MEHDLQHRWQTLSTSAILDLGFSGEPDVVDALFLDGVAQPKGIWGGVGSGADRTSPWISGTGLLYVASGPGAYSPSDFDENGRVDEDDLAAWRVVFGVVGSGTAMQGDADGDQDADGADFLVWQGEFGTGLAAAPVMSTVPEPTTLALLVAPSVLPRRKRLSLTA